MADKFVGTKIKLGRIHSNFVFSTLKFEIRIQIRLSKMRHSTEFDHQIPPEMSFYGLQKTSYWVQKVYFCFKITLTIIFGSNLTKFTQFRESWAEFDGQIWTSNSTFYVEF